MLIRLFSDTSWSSADLLGDFVFDALPAIGHKLALGIGGQWRCGDVREIVHRHMSTDDAADVALLLSPVMRAPIGAGPLPLDLLDGLTTVPIAPSPPPDRRGPWDR